MKKDFSGIDPKDSRMPDNARLSLKTGERHLIHKLIPDTILNPMLPGLILKASRHPLPMQRAVFTAAIMPLAPGRPYLSTFRA